MQIANASNSLPFGNLLLDKNTSDYNAKLTLLNSVQEIVDDFVLEVKHHRNIDSRLAVVYASDDSQENGVIPQSVQEFAELAQVFFRSFFIGYCAFREF